MKRALLAAVLAAVLAVACTSAPATTPTADRVDAIDWQDRTKIVDLGDGWTANPCEGDAPFLCVAADGVVVGTLEVLRFPVASFDLFDPSADARTNLGSLAVDFGKSIRFERAVSCGTEYRIESLGIEPFVVAGASGLRYGIRGINADGTPSEIAVQYATISGDDVVLLALNAYDADGCPGRDELAGFDTATLMSVQGKLEQAIRVMGLPTR